MSQVISLVAPSKAVTPARPSPMELDADHEGLQAAEAPESPSPRTVGGLARKRAASINTADASYAMFENLKINSASSTMSIDTPRDHICLCTPAPKIPRPRNVFILYRQHHQAQVVAENPNLSNPEISKIIGEQWKEEPEHVKETWKKMADEEKHRHQLQYPDYRYQPRRGNRAQANRPGTAPGDDGGRCPKCNGRSLAAPRTASLASSTPTAARPGISPYTPTVRGDDAEMARRGSFGSLPPGRQRFPSQASSTYYDTDEYDPEPPEMKRRRLTRANLHPISSPNIVPGPMGRAFSVGGPSSSAQPYEPSTFPDARDLTGTQTAPMPPPPRPSVSGHWDGQSPHTGRNPSFDESLRLPPLRTHRSQAMATDPETQHPNTPVTGLGISGPRAAPASKKSVAEHVMDIPVPNKLAVISRVCQEQPSRVPLSFEAGSRGAVISVDGPETRMLQQVGRAVEKALKAVGQFDVKSWENHTARDFPGGEGFRSNVDGEPIDIYSDTVKRWRDKSDEIRQHVIPQHGSSETSSRRGSAESNSSADSHGRPAPSTKTPVALLKEGYSLTVADMFACNAPIEDLYEPHDHWQWAATLWRKIIAADLVVYAMPTKEKDIPQYVTVHAQNRPALMIVRIPSGSDLDEATERRVAFEVVEWARRG